MGDFTAVFNRDVRIAFRRWSELASPLIFFVVVTSLFPLALSPDEEQLREVGTGVLWVAALLSSLLSLDGLFRSDADEGSMEQMILSPAPASITALAKIAAHWVVSSVPLMALAPLVAYSFHMPWQSMPVLVAALLFATPTLSVLAAIGAALTVSLRGGGSLIGLLVLPLASPVLIFATRATDLSVHGEPAAGPLYLLAAIAVLAVSLGPIAAAAAVKVGME